MEYVMIGLLALLGLVTSFGVGFILNMLTKFWLSSAVAFAALFAFLMAKTQGDLQIGDWILLAPVAFGAFASAFAIRTLRNRGFRMFQ